MSDLSKPALPNGWRAVTECIVRACIMPKYYGELCHHHLHFFDWPFSMTDRAIDIESLYNKDDPDPAATYFSILPYWEADVNKFEKSLKVEASQKIIVAVNGASIGSPYAPERVDARTNFQHGRDISRKGWGHKKIRKKQRMRPAGWHGSHPDQKPVKRWTRDTLEAIVMPNGDVEVVTTV